jgi:hypothetical protein
MLLLSWLGRCLLTACFTAVILAAAAGMLWHAYRADEAARLVRMVEDCNEQGGVADVDLTARRVDCWFAPSAARRDAY